MEGKSHSHPVTPRVYAIYYTYHCYFRLLPSGWGHVCWASPLHSYFPPTFPHCIFWNKGTPLGTNLKSRELLCFTSLRAEYLHKLLGILLHGDWSLLHGDFLFSFITCLFTCISMDSWILYTFGYNPVTLFCCSSGHRELFQLVPLSLQYTPMYIFFSFFCISLFSDTRCLRLWVFSAPFL